MRSSHGHRFGDRHSRKTHASIQQEGKASVSAKKLYEIVRELPEEMIQIEKEDNHWITLKCGKSTFNSCRLGSEEFPSLPAYKEESFSETFLPTGLWR